MLTPDDVRNATFRSRKRGKRGYDETEVDAFLDRVEAALRGEDPLTAEQVLNVAFSPRRRGKRAYAEEEVDALLDAAAKTLLERARRRLPTRSRARPEFSPPDRIDQSTRQVRAMSGVLPPVTQRPASVQAPASPQEPAYNADQVEAFLDRVEATLRGEDTLTAQDLLTVKFGPPHPGGRACPKSGVDAFLIQVALSIKQLSGHAQRGHGATPDSTAPSPLRADELQDLVFSCPPPGYPAYDQRQVDAFLRRVEATLRGNDLLTAREVAAVRFSPPPPGTRGYAESEVDAVLNLVREHLQGAMARGA
jgi:DivIVA domain-containing protein